MAKPGHSVWVLATPVIKSRTGKFVFNPGSWNEGSYGEGSTLTTVVPTTEGTPAMTGGTAEGENNRCGGNQKTVATPAPKASGPYVVADNAGGAP